MDPNIDDIDPGEEVDENMLDDAERDELAEREEAARAAGKPGGVDREAALEEMRKAMAGEAEVDDTAPPATPAAKPAAKPGDAPAPKADEPPAPDPEAEKAEAERVAAIDAEADQLNLKGKTRVRFRELTDLADSQGRAITALEALVPKFDDKDERPLEVRAAEQLAQHREFEDAIFATGLTDVDFKNVAGYKQSINSDDPAAWESALAFIEAERTFLLKRMGQIPDDGKDLLDEHPDLLERVQSGNLDREDAEAWAKDRNKQRASTSVRAERQQLTAAEQLTEQGVADCVQLAKDKGAEDRGRWVACWPTLQPLIKQIQKDYAPSEWKDRVELAYHRIPYTPPPAAPAAPRAGTLPRRPTPRPAGAAPGGMEREKPKDALSALREGFASVTPAKA